MANIFNAVTTGIGGISVAGDTSGSFAFAKDGTTVATISGTGVVNATEITGLTTALTAAQGGTGLTSPGTSGNVLTSNGSTWTSSALPAGGVTSLNGQTGAITNTDYGAIGSYVIAYGEVHVAYSVGSTIAGSSLYYTNSGSYGGMNYIAETGSNFNSSFRSASSLSAASLGLSGTWRVMTRGGSTPTGNIRQAHLWVRIS